MGIVDTGGTDQIVHRLIRDGEDLGTAVQMATTHILKVLTLTVVHLHPRDAFLEGIDKQEVVDGGTLFGSHTGTTLDMIGLHGYEGTEVVRIHDGLDFQLLTVPDVHGEPAIGPVCVVGRDDLL